MVYWLMSVIGVRTKPGQMIETVTPRGFKRPRMASPQTRTAALLAL